MLLRTLPSVLRSCDHSILSSFSVHCTGKCKSRSGTGKYVSFNAFWVAKVGTLGCPRYLQKCYLKLERWIKKYKSKKWSPLASWRLSIDVKINIVFYTPILFTSEPQLKSELKSRELTISFCFCLLINEVCRFSQSEHS